MNAITLRLRELLQSHHLRCWEAEDWLCLSPPGAPTGPRFRAHAELIQFQPGACSVQLDVEFLPWEGQRIIESCGGFGANVEQAELEALERFAEGALPVLLAAFLSRPNEGVRFERWTISGVVRQVILGKLQERGEPASEAATRAWLGAVERALQNLSLPTGAHWVRIFHAHQPEQPRTLEFLLDNHPCAELSAALEHAPWPTGPEATSQRVFLVIQGGLDVSRAVATFVEHAGSESGVIVQALMFRGASPLEAEKLLHYLPQAFARTLLTVKLPFPDTMHFVSVRRRGLWTMALPREPLWHEALRRAELCQSGESPLTQEQTLSIIRRHPGIDHAVASMQSPDPGRRIQKIAPLLATVTDEAAAQLREQRHEEPIPEELAPLVAALTETVLEDEENARATLKRGADGSPARRPWWKFWSSS